MKNKTFFHLRLITKTTLEM